MKFQYLLHFRITTFLKKTFASLLKKKNIKNVTQIKYLIERNKFISTP